MNYLFGKTFKILSAMLDYRAERSKVITSNIANLDTDDYKAADYVFKDSLRQSVEGKINLVTTDKKHFPIMRNEITSESFQLVKSEEKPDLDKQMISLAENQLMFNLSVEMLARKFRGLNNVLRDAK